MHYWKEQVVVSHTVGDESHRKASVLCSRCWDPFIFCSASACPVCVPCPSQAGDGREAVWFISDSDEDFPSGPQMRVVVFVPLSGSVLRSPIEEMNLFLFLLTFSLVEEN